MNKDKRQGFFAGVLASVLLLGLGGAALAAGRSIQVDDGVTITINGVPFTPRNAGGAEVPLFACEGTVYAPVRAISEAAGLGVDYDAESRTARLETADYAAQMDPSAGSYIGVDRAKELALADASVRAADARILKTCLDWENGKAIYDVEFCAGTAEYDYELDARTGGVLKRESELKNFDWSHHDDHHNNRGLAVYNVPHHSGGHHSGGNTNVIGDRAAQTTALEALPGGAVRQCRLECDDGVWYYDMEVWVNGAKYECEVQAFTGAILKMELDD